MENQNKASDSIIHKIKKLIEKSQSTDSIHESEALMLQAQTLLQKYNLEQSVIESHVSKNDVGEQITELRISYMESFEVQLCNAVGKNNFCFVINDIYKSPKELIIVGKSHNVESCIYLFNFFKSRLLELSIVAYTNFIIDRKTQLKELGIDFDAIKSGKEAVQKKYMDEYLVGGVHGIWSKMNKALIEFKSSGGGGRELMLYNDKALEKYVKENIGKTKKSKGKSANKGSDAYQKGVIDGGMINSGSGLSGSGGGKVHVQIRIA